MRIEVQPLGRVLCPNNFRDATGVLTHCANPVIVRINEIYSRIFFNSRDSFQRSSVYSIDINMETFVIKHKSFKVQHLITGENSYYKDGISLGSQFSYKGVKWIGFMGWINPVHEHWFGTIGKFKLDSELNLEFIEREPWFDLDFNDNISLSYPAVYFSDGEFKVWYGSTITWDAGNGEMVHILKEKSSKDGLKFKVTNREVEWRLGKFQAFSRPSIINVGNQHIMAYSVRGNTTKYRIGFALLENQNNPIQEIARFDPCEAEWASEMVEYPYLVAHNNILFMFYNGDGFGKSGIGVARVLIN